MKTSAVNASRAADQTMSGAAIELGEDRHGRHVLEIGGTPVAISNDYDKMAGLYLFLIQAAAPVVAALIDQVSDTTGARCSTCYRASHRPGSGFGNHGHTYTAPVSVPLVVA